MLRPTLASMTLLFVSASVAAAAGQAASPPAPSGVRDTGPWVNITAELFKSINAHDHRMPFMRFAQGFAVVPSTGNLFLHVSAGQAGLYLSKDEGQSWAAIPGVKLSGRGETGYSFNIPYPFDNRMAFFGIDGQGGITFDGGLTWTPFGKHYRGFDHGDLDWSTPRPQVIFAMEHEPFYKVLSTDGGTTWKRIDEAADKLAGNKEVQNWRVGVVNATTLLLADRRKEGILLSTDLGKTWAEVAKFRVLAGRPVHYGKRLYWAGSAGVVASDNGKDWALVGSGLASATWGPYFGKSEQEMMVVTDKGFFITADGAKTWKNVAPYFAVPDGYATARGYDAGGGLRYFGWDPIHNDLYASGLAAPVYRLRIGAN
jgi:photosystem II stability/assembly factor-like uncharacterized protein